MVDVVRPTPPRWLLPVLISCVVALVAASTIGGIFWATLIKDHPAVLISLNYRNTYLALASPRMDAFSFYGIAFVRSVLSDPLIYAIGFLYGDGVLRWAERKLRDGAALFVWLEKAFYKARYPMVALAPNNIICLLAGATRMPILAFAACNVAGTIARLVAIRLTGGFFDDELNAVTDFFDRYKWWFFGASLILFIVTSRNRKNEITELTELKQELEEEEPDPSS